MIDRETVDRIYAAANIVDIINDYVTLKKKGVNYQACCPFHNEKTPSFVVSPTKNLFRCFGCGKSGNAITFIMQHESMSYPEALKLVAKRYGIEVKEREQSAEEIARNDDRESMFTLNAWAMDYFSNYLTHENEGMSVGLSYFRQSRGFTDETIKRFALGFCPSKGDTMSRAARAAGYKAEYLTSTGLSLERESDRSLYDRFRDRVIFPVHNISGRIVAFGGRTLRTDKKVAKYQNSPESEIYSKKRELYGLFFAKKAIQQHGAVIMVEGYTDVISMHQAGIENVVSSSGTSLTVDQVRQLSRFTKNITVIYDGDAAGVKAAIRGIDIILKEGMNVRIVSLPPEHDPDSFARSHTAQQVQDYIRAEEEDFLTFKAKLLLRESQNDPIKRAEVIGEMVESICQIPDPIRRAVFAKECGKIMDIDESLLLMEIKRKLQQIKIPRVGGERAAYGSNSYNNNSSGYNNSSSQGAPQGGFMPPPDDLFIDDVEPSEGGAAPKPRARVVLSLNAGSSIEVLEAELLKYLLRSGHKRVMIDIGGSDYDDNVADCIFRELDECHEDEDVKFTNVIHNKILQLYREEWERLGVGVEVPTSRFLESDDAELCNRTVDLLTDGDNYVPSQMWRLPETEQRELALLRDGVKKAVVLYKSKIVERMIEIDNQRMLAEGVSIEEQMEILKSVTKLNKVKVELAHMLKRSIL